jgi:hypothetical protein
MIAQPKKYRLIFTRKKVKKKAFSQLMIWECSEFCARAITINHHIRASTLYPVILQEDR